MKKTVALILASVLALTLTACSGQQETPTTAIPTTATPTAATTAATEATTAATEATEPVTEAEPTENQEETTASPQSASSDEIRPEFKEAMDSYKAFYDEYCEFMLKYKKNPTDLSLLTQYSSMLSKMVDMDEAFNQWDEDEMTNAELKYYLEVNEYVMKKLVEVTE